MTVETVHHNLHKSMTMLTNKKRLLNEVMPVKRVSTFQKLEDHAYESKSNCISMTEKILQ